MPSSALFAGSRGPLIDALTEQADASGETVILADTNISETDTSASYIRVPWAPRSPLSARAVTTACVNACGSLERATVVISPARGEASLTSAGISEIERYLDEEVRSFVYLVRELLSHMERSGQGWLTIVLLEPAEGTSTVFQSLAGGAAEAFVSTVLDHYRESGPPVFGFTGTDEQEDVSAFAQFIEAEQRDRGTRIRGRMQRFGKRGAFRSLFSGN